MTRQVTCTEETLLKMTASFERQVKVMRETGAEASNRDDPIHAAHAYGLADGLAIAALACRAALDPQLTVVR